jgi:hypothetical protein
MLSKQALFFMFLVLEGSQFFEVFLERWESSFGKLVDSSCFY